MFVLVIGGAASGKSEYAENLCAKLAQGKNMLYIATMEPYGSEAKFRIERHHKLRKSKGFDTLEKYRDLWEIEACDAHTILLECMSTLLANEMFGRRDHELSSIESIQKGVERLQKSSVHLVIVSNKIFDDGVEYSEETMEYIRSLGKLNTMLAQKADVVVEVVCGIEVIRKGQEKLG